MPVISARLTLLLPRRKPSAKCPKLAAARCVAAMPVGVELAQELAAAGLFVGLADGRGGLAQSLERPQEAAIRLVPPAHVAAAPPTGLPEPVEAPVVADPVARIRLDVVTGELAEPRPCLEGGRPAFDDVGHRGG